MVLYQTQCKVEQSRAAVEQHGEEGGGGGDEEAYIPTHYHPQRLQDLQNNRKQRAQHEALLRDQNHKWFDKQILFK